MLHKKWLIVAVGLLSIAAGMMYNGMWFNFSFLGMEQGSEREVVSFWGNCSAILGLVLLLTLLLRPKMQTSLNDGQLIMLLSLLFVIQLPAFGLWLMGAMLGGLTALTGAGVHSALLLLISLTFITGKRNLAAGNAH